MRRRPAAIAILALGLVAAAAAAQESDLSGTWKLDRSASTIDAAVALAGLGGNAGIPGTLYVTQARNGTVIVGSDMNTSHARTYRAGRSHPAPLADGGEIEMTAQWARGSLVAEGLAEDRGIAIREAFTLAPEAGALRVEITVTTKDGEAWSRLVYVAATAESPCQEWPTPCKDWSQLARP